MPGPLGLTRIRFRAGASPGAAPLQIEPRGIVIVVGPNNSGKSLALREVEAWCFAEDGPRKVIETLEVQFPATPEEAEALMRAYESRPPPGQPAQPNAFYVGYPTFRSNQPVFETWVSPQQVRDAVAQRNMNGLRNTLTRAYTARLDGRTRFLLTDDKATGDLQRHPPHHLQALFVNRLARERVRALTAEAFGSYFVIDPTAIQQFRVRMSPRAPVSDEEEQSLSETSRRFHSQAETIDQLSDGVKAFVGLTSAVISLPHRVILIDEPEAFLHPPLARTLGQNLARIAAERGASLLVSTHSSQFLLGCVETGVPTDIVRLTYEGGVPTARHLEATALASIMLDPLMRSAGVLAALFHRAAIVTEADTDRSFYDEINFRLQSTQRGVKDALFLNANGKDSLHKIVGPLRRLGIPAAAIVDLDFIRSSPATWMSLLEACRVDATERAALDADRQTVATAFSQLPRTANQAEHIKRGGIPLLPEPARTTALNLLTRLGQWGLFVAPNGEVESWLPQLGSGMHGPGWLVDIFTKMGRTPTDANYVHPIQDDVWGFVDLVANWIANPNRRGTS